MIELYTWSTPNGRKASIMLEEIGAEYRVNPVDIDQDAQFTPEFLAISPNNKVPAIVDLDAEGGPLSIFESGAILIYLAEKSGRFLAPSGALRARALQWLFWQVGGLGPMLGQLGQLGHFATRAKERLPQAIDRFTDESRRLLGVMDKRLGEAEYLAGADYTIADIACYAWTLATTTTLRNALVGGPEYEHVARWLETVGARPAVQAGMLVPKSAG